MKQERILIPKTDTEFPATPESPQPETRPTDSVIQWTERKASDANSFLRSNSGEGFYSTTRRREYIENLVFKEVPVFFQTSLGAQDRMRFEKAIAKAKEIAPNDTNAMFLCAITYLTDFADNRRRQLEKSANENVADSSGSVLGENAVEEPADSNRK